jgi:membrane-bound metal-dependent hydrolase YbcI (DUF457 family)
MFIGHFAVGLAAKPIAPRVPLPVLLAAPQVLDILWPIFIATGVERMHIQPGITAVSPLGLDYMPWSHSLVMAAVWAIVVAAGYLAWNRDRRGAVVVAGLVLSHWVLDWVTHTPDMPLAPGVARRLGLGLWQSIPATIIIEGAMFGFGVWAYTRATRARDRIGSVAWWVMVVTLVAMYFGAIFGPPPPSVGAMTTVAFGGWIFLLWGWWIERHRELA